MSKNARKIGASLNETVHLFNKILGLIILYALKPDIRESVQLIKKKLLNNSFKIN